MKKLIFIALSVLCMAYCKRGRETGSDITAKLEIVDYSEDFGDSYRFLKISLTNHSLDTDYYLPYFVRDLKFDNLGYASDEHWYNLTYDVWFNDFFYDLNPDDFSNDVPNRYEYDIYKDRFEYRSVAGYDSLTKRAFNEYMDKVKIVSDNPIALDTLIRNNPYKHFGSSCVFINAGETVSTLVNIAMLYDLDTGTTITYNDIACRDIEMRYEEYLYRIKEHYDPHRQYTLYNVSDSLAMQWDGKVSFPIGYLPVVAGHYNLYDKQIKCADTIVVSRSWLN